jgi:hypothetical protein
MKNKSLGIFLGLNMLEGGSVLHAQEPVVHFEADQYVYDADLEGTEDLDDILSSRTEKTRTKKRLPIKRSKALPADEQEIKNQTKFKFHNELASFKVKDHPTFKKEFKKAMGQIQSAIAENFPKGSKTPPLEAIDQSENQSQKILLKQVRRIEEKAYPETPPSVEKHNDNNTETDFSGELKSGQKRKGEIGRFFDQGKSVTNKVNFPTGSSQNNAILSSGAQNTQKKKRSISRKIARFISEKATSAKESVSEIVKKVFSKIKKDPKQPSNGIKIKNPNEIKEKVQTGRWLQKGKDLIGGLLDQGKSVTNKVNFPTGSSQNNAMLSSGGQNTQKKKQSIFRKIERFLSEKATSAKESVSETLKKVFSTIKKDPKKPSKGIKNKNPNEIKEKVQTGRWLQKGKDLIGGLLDQGKSVTNSQDNANLKNLHSPSAETKKENILKIEGNNANNTGKDLSEKQKSQQERRDLDGELEGGQKGKDLIGGLLDQGKSVTNSQDNANLKNLHSPSAETKKENILKIEGHNANNTGKDLSEKQKSQQEQRDLDGELKGGQKGKDLIGGLLDQGKSVTNKTDSLKDNNSTNDIKILDDASGDQSGAGLDLKNTKEIVQEKNWKHVLEESLSKQNNKRNKAQHAIKNLKLDKEHPSHEEIKIFVKKLKDDNKISERIYNDFIELLNNSEQLEKNPTSPAYNTRSKKK